MKKTILDPEFQQMIHRVFYEAGVLPEHEYISTQVDDVRGFVTHIHGSQSFKIRKNFGYEAYVENGPIRFRITNKAVELHQSLLVGTLGEYERLTEALVGNKLFHQLPWKQDSAETKAMMFNIPRFFNDVNSDICFLIVWRKTPIFKGNEPEDPFVNQLDDKS
jgi:hypothetical protein